MKDTEKTVSTLTKQDVVRQLNAKTSLKQQDAAEALEVVLDTITQALLAGQHVEFRGFGVFEVVTRKARVGRNPNRPEDTVTIPDRKVVRFKPGKFLRSNYLDKKA